jgi:prepilin peptidase CpaA
MNSVPFPIAPCVLALVATAAAWDWQTRRIPNWLVALGLIVALPVQGMIHGEAGGIQIWFFGCLTGGLFFLPGYLIRAVGAGDVKLMAAVGAFCGVLGAVEIAMIACAVGGLWALVVLLKRRQVRAGLTNTVTMLLTMPDDVRESATGKAGMRTQSVGRLPFGVAIAIGTVWAILISA